MAKGKKLYKFVEYNDSIPVQKLTIGDQLRVLLKKLTEDPANELAVEDAVTTEYMTLKANLLNFLREATKPIREGHKREVIVNISNKFSPVFDSVLNSQEIRGFYDVYIVKPQIDYDIPYDIMVKLRVKES